MELEGHPIPQDITGFQFKLVGDMTVKQFAFLGVGLTLGWIIFSLPIPLIIKGPIAAVVTLVGMFFAFAPLSGRSADTMVLLFLRALFKPNQFVYKKPDAPITTTPSPVVTSVTTPAPEPLPTVFVQHDPRVQMPTQPAQQINKPTEPKPVQEPVPPSTPEENNQEAVLEEQLQKSQEEAQQQGAAGEAAHARVLELEKQLQEVLSQKQALENHVVTLQQQLTTKPETVFKPTDTLSQTPNVKVVPPPLKKDVGVPLTTPDVPNLITGIVKDPRGNVLQNILIEVKDTQEIPVRAFKTNQLGQFASATPLSNGTYTMHFEDPKKQQKFDTISITANGSIMQPLEVKSIDEREELRKSLFQTA